MKTGGTLSFEGTSVSVDLNDGEVLIDLLLLCKDCGGRISFIGKSWSPERMYEDRYLVCSECGKKGKIRDDRTQRITSIYKKVQLKPPEEFKR